jgi:DNA-directed RNA polymerase subunit E'/Rpb7
MSEFQPTHSAPPGIIQEKPNLTQEVLTKLRRRIENRLKRNPQLVVIVAKVLKIELDNN